MTIVSWLNYMTRPGDLAYSSMRFDFVLGYAGKYLKEYVDSMVRCQSSGRVLVRDTR